MRFRAMRVRIGRLVVERPAGEGVTAEALTDAVQSELTLRAKGEVSTTHPAGAAKPLAGAIAGSIANKLGWEVRR